MHSTNRRSTFKRAVVRVSTLLVLAIALRIGLAVGNASPMTLSSATLTVSASMDIWQAQGYVDGSDGAPPADFSFAAAPGLVVTFPSVTGSWTCSFITGEYGPDGTTGPCDNPDTSQNEGAAVGTFSGYQTVDFTGALVGMFLSDVLPASAPPTLTFYSNDSSQGGIQTNFTTLSPQIGQVFFIGDGLTETGGGALQSFNVPSAATHLYLGFVDACSHSGSGPPGCYHDNQGSMNVTLALSGVPEPNTFALIILAAAFCLGLRFVTARRSSHARDFDAAGAAIPHGTGRASHRTALLCHADLNPGEILSRAADRQ